MGFFSIALPRDRFGSAGVIVNYGTQMAADVDS